MAATKRTFKIHIFDLIAAMIFLGKKVTPEDITNHLHREVWGDADKYELLGAVQNALTTEISRQVGKKPEDHYGIRKAKDLDLYWLDYKIQEF